MTGADGRARSERWFAAGTGVAQRLSAQAVWVDGMCAFHGATPPESQHHPPRCRSLGGDVYEGSAGIARFLGMAAALGGDDTVRATALGAIRHALVASDGWPLFTGGMGIGLVALELAQRLDEAALVTPAIQLIDRASLSAMDRGAAHDLLVGIAGVIVGLVAAREYDLDGEWMARATQLGRTLLTAAVADGPSGVEGPPLSWPLGPGGAGDVDRLCGLAHGASGVALAFDALARVAADTAGAEVWRSAARRARRWERAYYLPQAGSWADLRSPEPGTPETPVSYPHMWCHGSIGIGAERLGAIVHDQMARTDAVGALAGVRIYAEQLMAGPAGPGGSDALNGSICHGLSGVIDLFVDAWRVTSDTSWMALAGSVADLVLNDARREGGWRSGVPGGWSAPGLMLGDAGIGWTLLRVARPEQVPSGWRLGPSRPLG